MILIPGPVIAALTFPGVVIHELAHQLFCRRFGIPVYQVCYFQFGDPAGYVVHGITDNWRHQVLVSAGPFFLNSSFAAILAFPSALRSFHFSGAATPFDMLLLWFAMSVAMHAIPSTVDAKAMWQAVSAKKVSLLARVAVAPLVGLIFLLAIGSMFWLDLVYAVGVCLVLPTMLAQFLS